MSGRIRTVKPEWLEDERLAAASDEARVLSIALMLMVDDFGNGRASMAIIAAGAWRYELERDDGAHAPETLAKASRALRELVAIGFVDLYEVSGQRYFAIRNWKKHQKVDRPSKPRVPGPDQAENTEETASSRDTRETLARHSRDTRETLAPDLRSPITDHDHDHDLARARDTGPDVVVVEPEANPEPEPVRYQPPKLSELIVARPDGERTVAGELFPARLFRVFEEVYGRKVTTRNLPMWGNSKAQQAAGGMLERSCRRAPDDPGWFYLRELASFCALAVAGDETARVHQNAFLAFASRFGDWAAILAGEEAA